jgi:ParB-like chromosome segregation protein Spo0J
MAKRKGAKTENQAGAMVGNITADLLPLALPLDSFTLDPRNCRKHGAESIAGIKASLAKFGQLKPITINTATGIVTAGNGTVIAARELGWSHLAAVRVAHDPATATGWAIADNRTAELSEWNDAELLAAAQSLEELDPELLAVLQLDELLPAATVDTAEPVEIPSKYSILIECTSETQQREVFERLQSGKFPPAKVLTI